MRKLLLASAAALGVSMGAAGYADAQVVYSSNLGSDASNPGTGTGPGNASSEDGQNYPTPGQVTVRLNGRFRFYYGEVANNSARTNFTTLPSSAAGTGSTSATNIPAIGANAAIPGNNVSAGYNKTGNNGIVEYARLYPGFDGVAANGLKYGASIELRQDNGSAAGGGAVSSVGSANARNGEFYIRREWGYIGTDQLGTLRLGASDQVTSLFLTGTFETFDDGGLDGDISFGFFNSANLLNFPFADQGGLYTTNKVVYVTPQFYGFDGGVDFEPSTATVGGDASNCPPGPGIGQTFTATGGAAAAGCNQLTSTSTGDVARRRNTYDALLRYRGTFGPVGIAATASYTGSGRVQDSGVQGSSVDPKHFPLEDLSVGAVGRGGPGGGGPAPPAPCPPRPPAAPAAAGPHGRGCLADAAARTRYNYNLAGLVGYVGLRPRSHRNAPIVAHRHMLGRCPKLLMTLGVDMPAFAGLRSGDVPV